MFIAPMLLHSREKAFSDQAYIFEPQIDGHRLILSKSEEETRLFTRQHNECTSQYPELWQVPIDGDVVLDGEVCCTDPETGQLDFGLVMERFQLKKKDKIQAFLNQRPVNYVIWDILFHKGRDLRGLPLMKRRSILESVLLPNNYFSLVPQIEEHGEDLYQSIVDKSMEGIVAKRKSSTYVSRRSHDWLKIINYQYTNVYLAGYRKDEFGWLAHVKENGKMRPAGIIELGVSPAQKKVFRGICKQLVSGEDKNFVYLDPPIQAKVKFRNWTRHGLLRTPSFVDFVL
ncbi:ATP-dependent DNA ligase [Paenibacillus agricola]|uniref:ATP-dependent DNA ligase n=1 Tax=Paenibacillus agricola TaxID=2716264 RepID=A0ABX0JDM4_9BACL|nr:ATP-dependent DNA ligase [Paenibacillus agricola]NHN33663.1 ATP-dependent DNA ligase [Paenibacillus agricola]